MVGTIHYIVETDGDDIRLLRMYRNVLIRRLRERYPGHKIVVELGFRHGGVVRGPAEVHRLAMALRDEYDGLRGSRGNG